MRTLPVVKISIAKGVTVTSSRTRPTKATSRIDECHTRTQKRNVLVALVLPRRIASTLRREDGNTRPRRLEVPPAVENRRSRAEAVNATSITRTMLGTGVETRDKN